MAVRRGQKNSKQPSGTLPKSLGLNNRLRSNVKTSGVGGGRMTTDKGRMGALKRTLKNAKSVIRKMKG